MDAGRVERFVRDDDQFLLAFLRNRKHDPSAALTVVKSFSKLWYSHPDIVEGLCAQRVRAFQDLHITQFLDGKDVAGNTCAALYMGAMKPGLFTPKQQVEFSLYTLCALFEDEAMQLHGVTYVDTLAGFSLWTAMKVARSLGDKEQQVGAALGGGGIGGFKSYGGRCCSGPLHVFSRALTTHPTPVVIVPPALAGPHEAADRHVSVAHPRNLRRGAVRG